MTGIDTTVPHSARIWNYWLGGTDNYAVDREAGDAYKEAFNQAQQGYNASGAVPYHLRSPEQFRRYFEGLDLVEPGVVPLVQWRPDTEDPDTEQAEIYSYCGVGCKP